jgi:hypothetical protein
LIETSNVRLNLNGHEQWLDEVRNSGEVIVSLEQTSYVVAYGRSLDQNPGGRRWYHAGKHIKGLPNHLRMLESCGPYRMFYEYAGERRGVQGPLQFVYVYNLDEKELKSYEYLDFISREANGEFHRLSLVEGNLRFELQPSGVPVMMYPGGKGFIDLGTKIEFKPNLLTHPPYASEYYDICIGESLVFYFQGTVAYIVDRKTCRVIEIRYFEPYNNMYPHYYANGLLWRETESRHSYIRTAWSLNGVNIKRLLTLACREGGISSGILRHIASFLCYK